MRYFTPPPPPQLKRLTVLAAALVALTLATSAQAQSCTRSTCAVTIKNVSPVADGCGEHATPARMSITWASTRSVTYNEGKTGRYAILFPPRTANNVPVDPADETRSRSDFPASINLTPSTIDPMTDRPGSKFTDWEWRNPNISGGRWKAAPDNLVGIPSQVGEHIFEVRPTAGARIWSNAGEVVLQNFAVLGSSRFHASGIAHLLFMGGKGCARVGPGGRLLGGIQ